MATVKQIKAEEAKWDARIAEKQAEWNAAPDTAAKKAITTEITALGQNKWHLNKLAAARQYRLRLKYDRLELPGELGVNTVEVSHTYEPDSSTEDEAWSALDGDNIEFLREHGLAETFKDLTEEDAGTGLALYLEARDLVLTLDAIPVQAAERITPEVKAFLASQWDSGLFTVYQCDLYDAFVLLHDEHEWLRLSEAGYDDDLGLYNRQTITA